MNPFVFSCITPHGGEILPELSGKNPNRMKKTRQSMEQLGEKMSVAKPDCIIVLTPHGTRINGQFSISGSERMEGQVDENGSVYKMERRVDRQIAAAIVTEGMSKGLSVGSINYGTTSGPFSCLPLDWGAIVPLRFMPNVPIIVITPSRELPFQSHLEFGKALREVVERSNKRIGLIASCDWSHTHDEFGPYGFHESAKKLDNDVVELIKSNRLEDMMKFSPEYIESAKPDGIWQTLILAGAIPKNERVVQFLSYEAPTYFGLICAEY